MSLNYKHILQYLFPPSEDEQNITSLQSEDFIDLIHIQCVEGTYTLLQYSDVRVRSAIHLLKFHNHTHACALLSAVLATYLSKTTSDIHIILPIPLSKKRERERGYNQVTKVIQHTLRILPTRRFEQRILIRNKNTIPQTSLSRTDRLHNLNSAFSIKHTHASRQKLEGKHVILVDDVVTTGATLRAAKSALLPLNPASITCVALAH